MIEFWSPILSSLLLCQGCRLERAARPKRAVVITPIRNARKTMIGRGALNFHKEDDAHRRAAVDGANGGRNDNKDRCAQNKHKALQIEFRSRCYVLHSVV